MLSLQIFTLGFVNVSILLDNFHLHSQNSDTGTGFFQLLLQLLYLRSLLTNDGMERVLSLDDTLFRGL